MRLRSLARLTRLWAPSWVRRPPGPLRAVVALTRRCNLRCSTCRTHALPPGDELTPDELGRLMASMPALGWLDLTGGEPMLRRDVGAAFDAVLAHTPSLAVLHFPTNGWFVEPAVDCARRVRARRPDVELLVTVSVDGPPALHDRMRGADGSFARAIECYRALRAVPGVQVYVGTTVGPQNRAALDATRAALTDALDDFDDRDWHWNLCQLSGHFFANEALATALRPADDVALVRRQIARRGRPRSAVELMELLFLAHLLDHLAGRGTPIPCQALHSTCFVSADGVLYPCHVHDRPLADLRAHGMRVDELWDDPALRRERAAIARGACGGCFTPCEAYPTLVGAPLRSALGGARWLLSIRAAGALGVTALDEAVS